MSPMDMERASGNLSAWAAGIVSRPIAFIISLGIVFVSAVAGPLFEFSDIWQRVVNTGITIVTFLMVFLTQNSQNRNAAAVHAKLDELFRVSNARDVSSAAVRQNTEHPRPHGLDDAPRKNDYLH